MNPPFAFPCKKTGEVSVYIFVFNGGYVYLLPVGVGVDIPVFDGGYAYLLPVGVAVGWLLDGTWGDPQAFMTKERVAMQRSVSSFLPIVVSLLSP